LEIYQKEYTYDARNPERQIKKFETVTKKEAPLSGLLNCGSRK